MSFNILLEIFFVPVLLTQCSQIILLTSTVPIFLFMRIFLFKCRLKNNFSLITKNFHHVASKHVHYVHSRMAQLVAHGPADLMIQIQTPAKDN